MKFGHGLKFSWGNTNYANPNKVTTEHDTDILFTFAKQELIVKQ